MKFSLKTRSIVCAAQTLPVPLDRKGKATEKATANEEGEGGEGGEGGKTEEGKGAGEGEGEGGKTETADRGGDRKGKAATPLTLPFGRRPQVP